MEFIIFSYKTDTAGENASPTRDVTGSVDSGGDFFCILPNGTGSIWSDNLAIGTAPPFTASEGGHGYTGPLRTKLDNMAAYAQFGYTYPSASQVRSRNWMATLLDKLQINSI